MGTAPHHNDVTDSVTETPRQNTEPLLIFELIMFPKTITCYISKKKTKTLLHRHLDMCIIGTQFRLAALYVNKNHVYIQDSVFDRIESALAHFFSSLSLNKSIQHLSTYTAFLTFAVPKYYSGY